MGLTVGQTYLIRVYNEGNTANIKNPSIRCVPQAPCGDCFTNPCVIGDINTNFSSSTFGSHLADCCTFPVSATGAVTQLNCAGPGLVSVDGNVWYSFTVCANGTVTATISYDGCDNTAGTQIWFLNGNCNGGTANFSNLACANNGDMAPATVSYNCTAGQTYYIMIDSYGGNVCDFNVSLSGPICIVLGKNIAYFDVKEKDENNALLSIATDETSFDDYIIEKSVDGFLFNRIKEFNGNGKQHFSFTDDIKNDGSEKIIYRLGKIERNNIEYLNAQVLLKKRNQTIYISSVDEKYVFVTKKPMDKLTLKIINNIGQEVYATTYVALRSGEHKLPLEEFPLNSGVYHLLFSDEQQQYSFKIIN